MLFKMFQRNASELAIVPRHFFFIFKYKKYYFENAANFESFQWKISKSINLFFLKSAF